MIMTRIRITPRQLVRRQFGMIELTPRAVETALATACRRGYVPNYTPPPEAYDQPLVLLAATSSFAAIYRHLAPDGSPTPVPRGLVESRTKVPLDNVMCGLQLARVGLAMIRVAGCCVVLRGTSTVMAHETNASRYFRQFPRPCWVIVERATGLVLPPAEIGDDLRLRTAMVYDEYDLKVDGLLDGENTCGVVSRWRFSPTPNPNEDMTPPF